MALAVAALDSGADDTNQFVYVTSSVTPTPNALQIVSFAVRSAGPIPAFVSLVGCGLTWVQIRSQDSGRLRTFRALGAAPTTGPLTITYGTTSPTACIWSWLEVTGVDTSGTNGSGAIVQQNGNTVGGSSGSIGTTLAARSNVQNILYEATCKVSNTAVTQPASWNEVHDLGTATDTTRLETAWFLGDDLAPTTTFAASSNKSIIALEIKVGPQIVTLTPATEADSAHALDVDKHVTLTPAVEGDAAQLLALAKAVTLTPATETETAQAQTARKLVTLTPATEADTAQDIVIQPPILSPRPSIDAFLDLEDRSRRVEGPVFEVLTASHQFRGLLAVDSDAAPRIRNDATAMIPRTINSLHIPPRTALTAEDPRLYADDIDTLVDRIRVKWRFGAGEGHPMYTLPWGLFLFADEGARLATFGAALDCQLNDQTQITAQLLAESIGFDVGMNVGAALAAVASLFGLVDVSIEPTAATLSAPVSGLSGHDTGDKIATDLCRAAGFLRPYFDNSGVWICRSAPDPAHLEIDHVYGRGDGRTGRVVSDSPFRSNGLLSAPNVYIVRDTSASESPVTGRYEVPTSARHSYANIGYWRPAGDDVQGLSDQLLADKTAQALYAEDPNVFSSLTFETPIDPRHDTFDVLAFDEDPYIEHEWEATLKQGGVMSHDGRRVFADA